MRQPATHPKLSRALCGAPVTLEEGRATAKLTTTEAMVADEEGLVHGGFVFGLVDHAAMLAVNHPFVVLGSAEVRFTAPVRQGEEVLAYAERTGQKGSKHVLAVRATVGGREVLTGTMTAFVLDKHVLE